MAEWWQGLTRLNQSFYSAAAFFGVFSIWQLIAALVGLGDHDADLDADADADSIDADDATATIDAFRLVSIRSIVSFFTLFTWGGALYLNQDVPVSSAMAYSVLWGLAGMFTVALIIWGMRKLTHVGTTQTSSCVGQYGTVYLDIPAGGTGEIRVSVSGIDSHVKARSAGGVALRSGTRVTVLKCLEEQVVLVEPAEGNASVAGTADSQ